MRSRYSGIVLDRNAIVLAVGRPGYAFGAIPAGGELSLRG